MNLKINTIKDPGKIKKTIIIIHKIINLSIRKKMKKTTTIQKSKSKFKETYRSNKK